MYRRHHQCRTCQPTPPEPPAGQRKWRVCVAGESRIKNRRGELQRVLSQEESYVDGKLSHAAFISIAILTFITFVGNFTQLQLSSALPIIVSEFHISVTTGQWLTSVFQLVMGVMVPLTAFLTRRFSTRQIVICSMAVFTLGSVLAWLGPNFVWVLVGRVLEAAGTGVMWPVLQITVFSIYPLSRRGFAMGTVGMAMSVAPAIGPTLGGWQTDANGWRSIFLTMTIIGVISLLAAMFGLHNFGSHDPSARADFFSVCLSVIGFGGLMFGFTNSETYGFAAPVTWGPMVVGLVGIVWFVLRNLRAGKRYREAVAKDKSALPQPPLLDLEVLKNRSFTVGTITASLAFFAFSSILVIMPLYIQTDRGYSATMSGLIMLPGAIGQCVSQFFGRPRDGSVRRAPGGFVRFDCVDPWHLGHVAGGDGYVDLVGIDLPVHPSDRHGFPADADYHVVPELPERAERSVRRIIGDEYRASDCGRCGRTRVGDSDGNVCRFA